MKYYYELTYRFSIFQVFFSGYGENHKFIKRFFITAKSQLHNYSTRLIIQALNLVENKNLGRTIIMKIQYLIIHMNEMTPKYFWTNEPTCPYRSLYFPANILTHAFFLISKTSLALGSISSLGFLITLSAPNPIPDNKNIQAIENYSEITLKIDDRRTSVGFHTTVCEYYTKSSKTK